MPKRNIAEIGLFVISAAACLVASGCTFGAKNGRAAPPNAQTAAFSKPKIVGRIEADTLTETSGLAASKCQPNVFWAHNDSGDDAIIYAINLKGETLGIFRIDGAANIDWEDIAATKDASGQCRIFIGDIGNNNLNRDRLTIYIVAEPRIDEATRKTTRSEPAKIELKTRIDFAYPSGARFDAETLVVEPKSGAVYVATKSKDSPASVFKLHETGDTRTLQIAELVGEITVPAVPNGLVTGGDIAPDGRSLVLCDYFSGYELKLPENATSFDEIWKAAPLPFDIGNREIGEAIAFTADGTAVISTSEKKNPPIYRIDRRDK